MAAATTSSEALPSGAPPPQANESVFRTFHEYRWDLDKDFLGGLVLALGGYHSLAKTASQADIIMHSRIFYFARIRGVTIPYAAYRHWLRDQYVSGRQPKIWEWALLEALCGHRDRLAARNPTAAAGAGEAAGQGAAAEREAWMRQLVEDGPPNGSTHDDASSATGPDWMRAAPRGELYVDRPTAADENEENDPNQVPYPERFAAIIKAVQSGEPVEGIVQIPDIVARNPATTPFGSMQRPRKPWEKDQPLPDGQSEERGPGLENALDQSFPEQDETENGTA